MQAGVVDADVVAELVDDRHPYLVDQVVLVAGVGAERDAEDGDPIRHLEEPVLPPGGERRPLVQAERIARPTVGDDDRQVVEHAQDLLGEPCERVVDEVLEAIGVDVDGHGTRRYRRWWSGRPRRVRNVDADRLLSGLDADQRLAVIEPRHPLCILAGAGSGKTRVLTRRIAHRAATGDADARHVLALTFTRRAAGEMRSRLEGLGLRDRPTVGTFHAIAWSQLRSLHLDRDRPAPNLLDRKVRLLTRLPGRLPLPPGELATEIEWARARLVDPDRYPDVAHQHDRRVSAPLDAVADAYRAYEAEKRRRGLVDFDDVLGRCADALDVDPTFAAAQHWRFRHLFVDEFQDVNPLQHRLLMAWLGDRDDLCVVGDPDQAIYRWNGADAGFLTGFARHHPGAVVVRLRTNYRSTPEVLSVATTALGGRRPTSARAHRESGAAPRIVRYATDADEAHGVAAAVRQAHVPGGRWDRQAVLVRTNAQIPLLEQALARARIPSRVRGASPLLAHPIVVEALRDLRNGPAVSLTVALTDLEARAADEADAGRTEPADALANVVRLGRELLVLEPHATPADLRPWLVTALGADGPGNDGDAVDLVTFHAAKGLEWPVVHLAGVEDGFVPVAHARTPEAEAEERRLLYVAATRAEDELHVSWAQERALRDRTVARRPSPYLDAMATEVAAAGLRAAPADPLPGLEASRAALGRATATDPDLALLRALREWRSRAARHAGVPDPVVLPDAVLSAIAHRRPTTVEDLAEVRGLGPISLAEHGESLLAVVGAAPDRAADRAPDPGGIPCAST